MTPSKRPFRPPSEPECLLRSLQRRQRNADRAVGIAAALSLAVVAALYALL
jgi:hypothetical protein